MNRTNSILSLFFLLIFLFVSSHLVGQEYSVGDNQFSDETTPIIQEEITLEEYNNALIISGYPPINEKNPMVSPNKTVFLQHEGFRAEAGEDMEDQEGYNTNYLEHEGDASFPFIDLIYKEELTPLPPSSTISGLTFAEDASLSGFFHIPADPSGAVGTTHVCHVVNSSIDCDTKAGATATGFPQSLAGFFTSLSPENASFDPKILWDQYENRFVAITLIRTATTAGDPADLSRILLAVSATADPTGTWYFQAIDVKQNISANDCWFDYPGFAIDDKAIYITGSYFRLSNNASCGSSNVVIIDKGVSGGIYDGTVSADEDPTTNDDFDIYRPSTEAGAGFNSTLQPAHTFGTPPSNMGTWLASYSGLSNGVNEALEFFKITNPLTTPTFTRQLLFVGNIDNTSSSISNAPQSGSAVTLETNDRRTLSAVWRNDKLWVTTQVVPPSGANAGQTTAYYMQFDADGTSNLSVSNQGEIGGEDVSTGAYTFFPSVAVDANDNGFVGFSTSNTDMFCGSYAVKVDGSTGFVTPTLAAQVGTDYYERTFGGDNRWGDYSNTRLDPSDGTIWAINKSAITRGNLLSGEDGQWGVYMVQFNTSEFLPIELLSFSGEVEGNNAILKWTTATELDNRGFDVQQLINGKYQTIDFVAGAGNSVSEKSYEYTDPELRPGIYYYRLNQKDFSGTENKTNVVAIQIGTSNDYFLSNPAPTIFNTRTNFELSVGATQEVRVKVHDVYGRLIGDIFNGIIPEQETKKFTLEGESLSDGYYFITVEGTFFRATKKVIHRK